MRRPLIAGLAAVAAALAAVPAEGSGLGGASPCAASQLTLRLGAEVVPMTGEHAAMYVLRNHSRRSCLLGGYPSVRLLDRTRHVLPFRRENGRGTYVTHARPRLLLVASGRRAYFLVAKYRCDRGDARRARSVVARAPGGGRLRDSVPRPADLALCRGGRSDPGNVLQLSPLTATPEETRPS